MAHVADPFSLHEGAAETWRYLDEEVLRRGVVDQSVKDLALRYVRHPDAVDPAAYAGRERAALDWAFAIVWDAAAATDELWTRLHVLYTEEELVDLGCAIGFELGRSHFLAALGADQPAT
ncbi:MAG: hypothetical protein ACRDLK_04775 [Gaiellaceae bacterium]